MEILTATEAADRLDMPYATMIDWLRKGRIAGAERRGRIWFVPSTSLAHLAIPPNPLNDPRRKYLKNNS